MKSTRNIFLGCSMVAILLICSQALAMEFAFKDTILSFQALRTISATAGGGADIGECLKTLYRVKEDDIESWYQEWRKAAVRRAKTGAEFLSKGHTVSAGQVSTSVRQAITGQRSSSYTRTLRMTASSKHGVRAVIVS